jgi:predicted nucleic-acid-binding protein
LDRRDEFGHRSTRRVGAMIGLDTNVVVRYIMLDDAKQSPKAAKLIESLTVDAPGFVSIVSIVELGWVLSSCYGLTRQQLAQAFEALLRTKEIVIDRVLKALRVFKATSADLTDCLIERSAVSAGCARTMMFDIGAAKTAGMSLIH